MKAEQPALFSRSEALGEKPEPKQPQPPDTPMTNLTDAAGDEDGTYPTKSIEEGLPDPEDYLEDFSDTYPPSKPPLAFGEAKTSLPKFSEKDFREIVWETQNRLKAMWREKIINEENKPDDGTTAIEAKIRSFRGHDPEQFDKVFSDICEERYGQRFTPLDIPVEWDTYRVVKDNYESIIAKGTETYIRQAIRTGKMSEYGAGSSFETQADEQSIKFIGVDLRHAISLSTILEYSDLPSDWVWKDWDKLSDDQKAYYLEQYLRSSI
jgi:hypothetical protein